MESTHETSDGDVPNENSYIVLRSPCYPTASLSWLDLRVFCVRVSRCEVDDDSTPEYLMVNHIPLEPDTLLELNGVRTSIYSDGASSLLRRDRLDKQSEEATFVSTDCVRMMGSVKFEVFDKDVLLLSGVVQRSNGSGDGWEWGMNCESNVAVGSGFLKARHYMGADSASPTIEVYVAGSFRTSPIFLTKTLQLGFRKKQMRKGMLHSIPEYEATEEQKDFPPALPALQRLDSSYQKAESSEAYSQMYAGGEYLDGEDGEMSWFNAGVRVGVGIGLSVCLGIGIGVGLLVRTYQNTTSNFRRRLL